MKYETVQLTIRESNDYYVAEISPDGGFNVIQFGDNPIEDILKDVDFGKHRSKYEIAKEVLHKWLDYTDADDPPDRYVTVNVLRCK